MAKSSGTFKFRAGDAIGAVDAEQDQKYLNSCFVDNGDVKKLLDCSSNKSIVVGRTGSGKTALLLEIEKRAGEKCQRIEPESLSLNYIANSESVRILTELNVVLDPFFRLLWRHVLALHIFQYLRPIAESERKEGFVKWALRVIRADKTTAEKRARYERVIAFLDKYVGREFWGDVGQRVKSIVYKFEEEIEKQTSDKKEIAAGVEYGIAKMDASLGRSSSRIGKERISEEQAVIQRQRFQNVINEMRLKELQGIFDLMSAVLEDAGQDVYIIIDKLDGPWVDEAIRFRLIRALLDTVVAFKEVPRVKVIVAMRLDLIERVYREGRLEPGTQFEKVKDHSLVLTWDRAALTKVADERVARLASDRYAPTFRPKLADVVNPKIKKGRHKGQSTVEFLLSRTWGRPRDLIDLVNECINRASGSPRITDDALVDGEGDYSKIRLNSLAEEWQLEYPYLIETVRSLLGRRESKIKVSELSEEHLHVWMDAILKLPERDGDRIRKIATEMNLEGQTDRTRVQLAAILYRVGCVGIQTNADEKPTWISNFSNAISAEEITPDTILYVHLGLWRALGIV